MKWKIPMVLCLLLTINGCSLLASLFEKPKGGGSSPAEVAAQLTGGIPVWGQVVGGVVTLGTLLFGGKAVHKHVKKKRAAKAAAAAAIH